MNVAAIYVYPVKSCRGIARAAAELTLRGLARDRRWMVTGADGVFVTQRVVPRMSLVDVRQAGDELELGLAGHGTTRIPLEHDGAEMLSVRVFDDQLTAAVHAEGSRWISDALGGDYRLVYMRDDVVRAVNPARGRPGDMVSFADAYPLLLVGSASLADLNGRLAQPVGVERFRPNVVIDGSPPYAEDGWRRIAIGELAFRVPKPCDRCTIPGIDPATGQRGVEPLCTLATYRKRDGKVWFGVNLIPDAPGAIAVGDEVRLIA